MAYWVFHLVFILPIIGVLLYLNWKAGFKSLPQLPVGVALVALAALIYTTPWDNYLIYRGVWSYQLDRISGALRIGYVPLEEYCFFLLQPILTGLYLLHFMNRSREVGVDYWVPAARRDWLPCIFGGLFFLLLGFSGLLALLQAGHLTYLGLILVWASPVLAFHWFYGGDFLWRTRGVFSAALVSSTAYLWVVDRIAIEWKIWQISPAFSIGWNILGLPIEEALFFLLTNLLIIQGILLFCQFVAKREKGGGL